MAPRLLGATLLAAMIVGTAAAEGLPDKPKASSKDRITGAGSVLAIPGRIVPLGGSSLRLYDRRSAVTRTVRPRERDLITAVGTDAAGKRLLVAWKWDEDLHVYDLASSAHATMPRPNYNGSIASRLAFSADGKSVFVLDTGVGGGSEVYRRPIDPKGEAKLLFGGAIGDLVWFSPREVISQCQQYLCPDARIVWRDLETGAQKVLAESDDPRAGLPTATAVTGSVDGDVLLHLGDRLLRFRARDGAAVNIELPKEIINFVGNKVPPIAFVPARDQAVLVTQPGRDLAVWTISVASGARAEPKRVLVSDLHPPPPVPPAGGTLDDEQSRTRHWPPGPPTVTSFVYAFVARADGTALIHWGDDLVFVYPDGRTRAVDLRTAAGGTYEWAGVDVLADSPDELWVGVEVGASRDFLRIPLAKLEAK